MARGPRPRDAALLGRRALRFVLVTGSVKASLGLGMLVVLPVLGLTTLATRTAVFLYETLAQLAYAYPSRQLEERPLGNRVLNAIVVLSALLQPLLVYLPGARRLLGLERIEFVAWSWVVGAVAAAWLFADVYSRRMRGESPGGAVAAGNPPGSGGIGP